VLFFALSWLPAACAHTPGIDESNLYLSAAVNARLSIIPGVKERFELTEVVEQTGSPIPRRRTKAAFDCDSPQKSPTTRSRSPSRSPTKRGRPSAQP
jgi:hypothetical protein